jgi:prepilin-type N-terminal cleavage/methylation domain-containing protein
MKIRRQAFTLLETLIALAMSGLLLTALLGKVQDVARLRTDVAAAERECLERHMVQICLTNCLSSLCYIEREGNRLSPLYMEDKKVCFHRREKSDPDPLFVGELSYRLWYDPPTKTLQLLCANSGEETRSTILATQLLSCVFHLYGEEDHSWLAEWPSEREQAPTFLSISCEKKGGSVSYLIPIHVQI